jgi:hypothetical protein
MGQQKYLELLRKELVLFMDELILLLPDESDLVVIKLLIQDVINIEDVMKYIHTHLSPLEEYVKRRDETFFLDRCVLFDALQDDTLEKADYFKQIWRQEQDDNKEMIWNWFDHFIALSKKYFS